MLLVYLPLTNLSISYNIYKLLFDDWKAIVPGMKYLKPLLLALFELALWLVMVVAVVMLIAGKEAGKLDQVVDSAPLIIVTMLCCIYLHMVKHTSQPSYTKP